MSSSVFRLIAMTSSSLELIRATVMPSRYKLSGSMLILCWYLAAKYLSRIETAVKKVDGELRFKARKT